MSDLFWSMHNELKQDLLFRGSKLFACFLWAILPITIGMYLGWVIADKMGQL